MLTINKGFLIKISGTALIGIYHCTRTMASLPSSFVDLLQTDVTLDSAALPDQLSNQVNHYQGDQYEQDCPDQP